MKRSLLVLLAAFVVVQSASNDPAMDVVEAPAGAQAVVKPFPPSGADIDGAPLEVGQQQVFEARPKW